MQLNGKNVFISGGASGIGLAAAKLFASKGANVFSFSIDSQEIREKAEQEIREACLSQDQRVEAVQLDVTDHDAVQKVLGHACESFGAPYVLVNSAGMGGAIVFEEMTYERFDNMFKVNVYGIRNVVAACLPHMKPQGEGYIVNVSSMSGLVGLYGYTGYSSSKFAVVGFSYALRAEMKPYGIHVSVACPVQVDTPLLAETNRYKPEVTKAINANAGVMTAEECVRGMLDGMERDEAVIIPGRKGRMVYLFQRLFPGLREFMTDRIVRKLHGAPHEDAPTK